MDLGVARARGTGRAAAAIASLPAPVLRRVFGTPPPAAAGLAPDAWAIARLGSLARDRDLPLEVMRARTNALGMQLSRRLAPGVGSSDRTLAGPAGPLLVRTYVPPGAPAHGPLLVWLHGGGWVLRDVDTHDAALRFLSLSAGVRIASVDYRLAPEHPFPAPLDDALAAWSAVAGDPGAFGGEPGRVAIGGDSAGGNLAVAVALAARDGAAPPPSAQVLLYPVCDVPGAHPSYRLFADGFYLTAASMAFYFRAYAGADEAAWADPRVAVGRADLTGLPPTHVATALADPLRDEGEALAESLRNAGVPVTAHRHPLLHGFLNMTAGASARDAVAQLGGVVRATL